MPLVHVYNSPRKQRQKQEGCFKFVTRIFYIESSKSAGMKLFLTETKQGIKKEQSLWGTPVTPMPRVRGGNSLQ